VKSIVLLSGGLDSTICFREAVDSHETQLALFFDYGQIAIDKELEAASGIASRLGVRFESIELPWLKPLCRSPLVDTDAQWPDLTEQEIASCSEAAQESAKQVWIPNRNAIFINVAAAFAESIGAEKIIVGFNKDEAATFPDNSLPFLEAVNNSLRFSTHQTVQVEAPCKDMTKGQIVRRGKELNAPLDLIWSCYKAGRKMCWQCESCLRLKSAMEENDSFDWFKTLSYKHG
jgi:7-cyano-7-deazaguanine synthase